MSWVWQTKLSRKLIESDICINEDVVCHASYIEQRWWQKKIIQNDFVYLQERIRDR
jgi:hypothetical protein